MRSDGYLRCTGCVNAPLPAEFWPIALLATGLAQNIIPASFIDPPILSVFSKVHIQTRESVRDLFALELGDATASQHSAKSILFSPGHQCKVIFPLGVMSNWNDS